ncbi:hypothetical protein HID58_059188 [Brassica napus]|uniref:Uncharacterized protein n=1 Tax=Brassica napus TaxID=3708 RepID=A0ABQ7ZS71_BRANA|nr:hypothetical protein HID58_059188 [Brassica napus]
MANLQRHTFITRGAYDHLLRFVGMVFQVFGSKGTDVVLTVEQFCCDRPNPILQIIYIAIIGSVYFVIAKSSFVYIPGYYIGDVHSKNTYNFPKTSMEPTNHSLTRLDTMPDDMLCLIISKVGAALSTDDPLIAKTLSVAPLVERPHLANGYEKMMESLLAANNLDAHYVKGMREYFYFDNHFLGLHHLRLASKGDHK